MCGLIGAFRADDANWTKIQHFMWQGLYISALRGMGGTGAGLVHRDYETDVAKSHCSAINFLGSQEWEWVEKNIFQSRSIIGHTRSATLGAVKTLNSHPFRFTDKENEVVMIHNGHVSNYHSLTPATFKHDVDSAHVAYSLLTRGGLATLEMLQGAYTLIWYDKKTKTMNLARNEERELYYAMDKDKGKFYFASEIDFLASLLRRLDIPHVDEFFQLDTHTLYQFDLTKKILVAKKTKYEEKKSPPVETWQGNYQSGSGGHYGAGKEYKSFTKNFPNITDYIWVNCHAQKDDEINLYKPISETLDQHAYGHIYGTRAMESGSLVRINGILLGDWKEELHLIKNCIPVKITKVERNQKDLQTHKEYTYYEGMIDHDEADKDIKRAKDRIVADAKAAERRKDYEAALAAGRAVPVGTYPALPGPINMGGGNASLGVGMGPPNGGAAAGPNGRLGGLEAFEPVITYVRGPNGKMITIREWKDIAQDGCYFCHGKFDIQVDQGKVAFFEHPRNPEDRKDDDAEFQMICTCCMDDPEKLAACG